MAEVNLFSGHYHSAPKTDANVRTRREKEGQCADCGLQTYRIEKRLARPAKRIPLTVKGQVLRGRCLLCNPLPPSLMAPAKSQGSSNFSQQPSQYPTPAKPNPAVIVTNALPVNTIANQLDIKTNISLLSRTFNEDEAFRMLDYLAGKDKRKETVNCNGVSVIVSAMKRFPNSWRVQNRSIQLLGNLVFEDRSSAAMKEGIVLIIDGTERHLDHNMGAGSCSLYFVSQADDNLIRSVNAIPRFATLLRKMGHREESRSDMTCSDVETMINTITLLTCRNYGNRRAIAETDIVSIIVRQMNIHCNDNTLLEKGCSSLSNIGCGEERHANQVLQKGGITQIINALRSSLSPWLMSGPSQYLTGKTHSWSLSERVAKKAIGALCRLSHFRVVVDHVRGQGIDPLLRTAIQKFSKLQASASEILNKL